MKDLNVYRLELYKMSIPTKKFVLFSNRNKKKLPVVLFSETVTDIRKFSVNVPSELI